MKMNENELNKILYKNGSDRFSGIECGEGWIPLILELHQKNLEIDPDYVIYQVKEKFRFLRFYFEPSNYDLYEQLEQNVAEYEKKSGLICEFCGGEGEFRLFGKYWMKTSCEDCEKAYVENVYINSKTKGGDA